MNLDDNDCNPFAALMSAKQTKKELSEKECIENDLLVAIFRFVVNPINSDHCLHANNDRKYSKVVCVSLVSDSNSDQLLSLLNVDQYLCERLLLADASEERVEAYVVTDSLGSDLFDDHCEQRALHYLYQCFYRIETNTSTRLSTQQKIYLKKVVINQSALILCHPEISPNFDDTRIEPLFLQLLDDYGSDMNQKAILRSFVTRMADEIVAKVGKGDEDVTLLSALRTSYAALSKRFTRMSLIDRTLAPTLQLIHHFVCNANLANCFVQLITPNRNGENALIGSDFQNTLIGLILSISCLPRPTNNQFEFFLNPSQYSQHEHNVTEKNLGIQLNVVIDEVHNLFYTLLKQHETRKSTIDWIEQCLHCFGDRAKIWTNELLMLTGSAQNSSDGFMINLSAILLQLSKPFCVPPYQKMLKIDARYCRLTNNNLGNAKYLAAIRAEPFLIPSEANEITDEDFELNFMTQCFIATHKALHLGFRVVNERFFKLVQDLNQIQHLYEEANQQTNTQSDQSSDTLQMLRQRMDKSMTQFLAIKTMLSEPHYLESMFNFHIATAIWLNNLAVNQNQCEAAKELRTISLPLSRESHSQCLKCVPEFIVENIADLIIFVRRFSDKTLAFQAINLDALMTLILIFMGSPERMKNPHLRARLAEMLEALMPDMQNEANRYSFSSQTEKLFTDHPSISELVPTLVHVFVSIEISESSGESVAFEQKFQYRRPMYIVLKYLWGKEQHCLRMKELAEWAEANMESISPPLFLRFINLLMNDAIYLLDEALSFMSKLRELQQERDSGGWSKLATHQRQQNEANFQHTGRLARFHNIIGRETIHTLSWLTEHIKTIFSHKTLVDRMAAMLNYFLQHLVGPKKRNFKVKDMSEYDFKPADIVHDICRIYLNLSTQENKKFKSFCLAVGRDDRSYSPQLLPLACDVLIKTGYASLSSETSQMAQLIEKLLQYQMRREISLSEVPEHFLDPIMSTLMSDPVILPNSGVRVDRSTIARHLLSDQSDPFTRAPLTMDLIKTDIELKEKIKQFINEKLKDKEEKLKIK